jgi:hypothetical protein
MALYRGAQLEACFTHAHVPDDDDLEHVGRWRAHKPHSLFKKEKKIIVV